MYEGIQLHERHVTLPLHLDHYFPPTMKMFVRLRREMPHSGRNRFDDDKGRTLKPLRVAIPRT